MKSQVLDTVCCNIQPGSQPTPTQVQDTTRVVEVSGGRNTNLPCAKANAPGQRLDLMMAMAYWGSNSDETLPVHAGMPLTAVEREWAAQNNAQSLLH